MSEERSDRGRKARARGNAYERHVALRLNLSRVGHYGGPVDVQGDWLAVQCKVGDAYPERIDRWIRKMPSKQGQLRAVVIGDAPGPGAKRREIIAMDLSEFIEWFVARNETDVLG